jgi:hypothetical protein
MNRERFWGLYDYSDAWWWASDGKLRAALTNLKRMRFKSAREAAEYAKQRDFRSSICPRPFYVTRKAKNIITPEAAAVIDAARKHVAEDGDEVDSWHLEIAKALQRYDASK